MPEVRIRGVYGTPWSKLAGGIEISKEILRKLGQCLVDAMAEEAKKDFAKRGWSGRDPMGGPPIWDSFSYQIRGRSTVEVLSTFYGLDALVSGDIPEREMVWLRSDGKPPPDLGSRKETRDREYTYQLGRPSNRSPRAQKRNLLVPIRTERGTVVFRHAPFRTQKAWVHPGIARFTFTERAIKKGRERCAQVLGEEVIRQLAEGDPTR